MKKKDAINVAFYQSVFYLIIGLALGLVPWQEHRYILAIIVLALFIAMHRFVQRRQPLAPEI